ITIINKTINITNIAYNRAITYAGGPNFFSLNQEIQKRGGRAIAAVNVTRLGDVGKFQAGQFARKQGNQLALLSPRIQDGVVATHTPKIAETLGSDKTDKGWPKDPKIKNDLKNRIAEQTKGQNPKTTKATLPADVAQNVLKKHGGGQHPADGFNQHPGPKHPNQLNKPGQPSPGDPVAKHGGAQPPASTFDQHPGPKHPNQPNKPGQPGAGDPIAKGGSARPPGSPFDQHPGPKHPNQPNKPGQPGAGDTVAKVPGGDSVVNKPQMRNTPPAPSGDRKPRGTRGDSVVNKPPMRTDPRAPSGNQKPRRTGEDSVINNP